MSRTTPRHGVGGIFIDGDVLMRDDITTTAKLVYGYACKYVVTDDRQRDGGLQVGQVWLRTRQRHGDRPGVDEALGISHGAAQRAIESLIEHGLLRFAHQPTMAERRAGKVTVYWVAALAPDHVRQIDSPRNVDSDGPQNVDCDSPRNEGCDSPQNGGCDSPRNGGCLYEGSSVRSDDVAAAAAAATVESVIQVFNDLTGAAWTASSFRTRIQATIDAHPELTLADHRRIITVQRDATWRKAPFQPNHVYANLEQFERCMVDAAQPAASGAAATSEPADGLSAEERDAIKAYRNTGETGFLREIDVWGSAAARWLASAARSEQEGDAEAAEHAQRMYRQALEEAAA